MNSPNPHQEMHFIMSFRFEKAINQQPNITRMQNFFLDFFLKGKLPVENCCRFGPKEENDNEEEKNTRDQRQQSITRFLKNHPSC